MEITKDDMLTINEANIMKAVWDAGGDISLQDLLVKLRDYGKDYARTTVVTFLMKIEVKGYLTTYRKGRSSYVRALKGEEEYKEKLLREMVDFWYGGDISAMVAKLDDMRSRE